MMMNNKFASNVTLVERNRLRGWIAIIREGKGFIEQNGTTDNTEAVMFSTNALTGDNTSIDLGDEVEFSLRKFSGRFVAENIVKVPLTINNYYVSTLFDFLINGNLFSMVVFSQPFQRFIEVALYHLFE